MRFILCLLYFSLCYNITFAQFAKQNIQQYLEANHIKMGLSKHDVSSWIITDQHTSRQSGISHVYLRQQLNGIAIHGADLSIHQAPDGTLWSSGSRFVANAKKRIGNSQVSIEPASAIAIAAEDMGYVLSRSPQKINHPSTSAGETWYRLDAFSREPIPVKLVYQKMPDGQLRLAYDLAINEANNGYWWGVRVDAQTGKMLEKDSWTISCKWDHTHEQSCSQQHFETEIAIPLAPTTILANASYKVFPAPIESPSHGSQTTVVDPADIDASPYGWHDLDGIVGAEETRAKGNNVQAHLDLTDSDDQSGFSPDGGIDLDFDFTFDPLVDPSDNNFRSAAVTNLFYWNNLTHDVLYHYGFDEEAGNFQENNYGNGGEDGDSVNADAQDGSGTDNANFGTPPDGLNPRMQMFIWVDANPDRDSDFDNGVIVHEYAHGLSNRLTGGAKNVSCLSNVEQMGEGWSDYLALIMTIEAGDTGADARGIGTYVLDEPVTGDGIRTHPYSTDMMINPHTYDDIKTESQPHGVGSVWCAMLWEMTWALIGEYGFDSDLYHGTGGNNIALQLVIEALKLQPCSPGFVDGRNAILKADQILYGGANQCLIWQAFAKRGLGYSADQVLSDSKTDGIEAFDLAPDCLFKISMSGTTNVLTGNDIDYTIELENVSGGPLNNFVLTNPIPDSSSLILSSISDGGIENNGAVEWNIPSIADGVVVSRTFSVTTNASIPFGVSYSDDVDIDGAIWEGYSNNPSRSEWTRVDQGGGDFEWFASEPDNHTDQYLTLVPTFKITSNSLLSFNHAFDTEDTWDGGQVHISTDGGIFWEDLGTRMTQNGYNSTINDNSLAPAFAGNSMGYQTTIVDLSEFAGELVKIRFWFHADAAVGGNGWYIDDIQFTDIDFTIDNEATAVQNGLSLSTQMPVPTILDNSALPVSLGSFDGYTMAQHNLIEWNTLSEQNVESFKVHRSRDGKHNWIELSEVAAKGNSLQKQSYEVKDQNPWTETFYRLEIIDFDGSAKLSPVIRLVREALSLSTFDVYPNPFNQELQLSFNLQKKDQAFVSIKDLYGREILNTMLDGTKGTNFHAIAPPTLPSGVYLIHILADGQQRSQKLIKE